jgi:N-hydroxyarylamine O-acetyltransferase
LFIDGPSTAAMDLTAYLRRIEFTDRPRPDLETLVALHRHHLLHIPYENLDVQLGRTLDLDPAAAFDKLVRRRRGGWCYEMNGVFSAALQEIGFRVSPIAGAVRRDERGKESIGNHLVLRVELDRPYLADVGFGDSLIEPIPLEAGAYIQGARTFRLEPGADGWWRFHNHARSAVPYFDFRPDEVAAPEALAAASADLQVSPQSTFVLNLICQRHTLRGVSLLLGRVLHLAGAPAVTILRSPEELVATLAVEFGLDAPQAASLWPAICARHQVLFPTSRPDAPAPLLARRS